MSDCSQAITQADTSPCECAGWYALTRQNCDPDTRRGARPSPGSQRHPRSPIHHRCFSARLSGPALCCERCEHLPGGAEDGEVPVAGVELKLCARYRRGEQPGVLGRDRSVGIAVVDRCRCGDGTQLETPGPQEHPQVLGNSPAALAECLAVC